MDLICLFCAFFIAGGQPGTKEWYQKNADDAVALAQKGMKTEAMRLIDEMKQVADGQGKEIWKLYVKRKKGSCEFALGDLRQAIATWKEIEGKETFSQLNLVLRDLGDAYLASGDVASADAYFTKALTRNADAKDKIKKLELISIELKQIQCKVGLTKKGEARQRLKSCRAEIDQVKQEAHAEVWACLDSRWNMLQAGMELDGRNPLRALMLLEKCQNSLRQFPSSPEPLDLRFKCHVNLAEDYWLLARFADADGHLKLAEKIVVVAKTERNLASLKNARAALLIEKTAITLENEFQPEEILADLKQAEANLIAALDHLAITGSGPDILSATMDYQLCQVHELRGRVFAFQGKPDEADVELKKAKGRCEKTLAWRLDAFGPNHVLVLEARARRAWLNLRLGDAKAAQEEGADALKRFDGDHKKNDIDRGRYLHLLLEAENRLGRTADAARYAVEHRRLVDAGLNSLLAGLSAAEQIQFFRKWDTPGLNASLRLAIEHAGNQQITANSVEWLINGKAKLAEVLGTQINAARHGDHAAFVSYQKSVERQVYLMYGEPATDSLSRQKEFFFEELKKRDLTQAAVQQPMPEPHWYTLPEVRANLAKDELYVGIYCVRPRENAARVYHAWLVARDGPVQMAPLGEARNIENLVKVFLREQERVPFIAPGEEKWSEQYLRKNCLEELSERVLHPIQKLAGGRKRWVISPDGPLWNIPWSALLLQDKRYALEEMTFRYAVSGQNLAAAQTPANLGAPLVLGDPWFNYPGTDGQRLRKPGLDPLRLPFDRLEYSRRDCETVLAILDDYKLKPNRVPGPMRKEQLGALTRPPRYVYLSTHAYATLPSRVEVDDPFLSCALAFAGWNYLPSAQEASLPGMMTGAEVLGVDLHGTELVVLASCEAGRGELSFGQSPANLRHAFHLAGARTVVSALWGINDKSTLQLMEPFVASICRPNADKVGALREAQQQSLRYLRMYRGHTHPFYWAGFTISGS